MIVKKKQLNKDTTEESGICIGFEIRVLQLGFYRSACKRPRV